MASGGSACVVKIWDMKRKEVVKNMKGHSQAISSITFSNEGTSVASGSLSGDVVVHSLLNSSVAPPKALRSPQTDAVRQVTYSPFHNSILGSCTDDGSVALWDVGMMRSKHHFDRIHTAPTTGLAFSPFNHLLLCSASLDKRILFHDVNDCSTVKEIVADEPISSLSFMDDGVTVAVGTLKGTVLIYDLRAGNSPKYTSQSHKGAVNSLAFQQSAPNSRSKLTKANVTANAARNHDSSSSSSRAGSSSVAGGGGSGSVAPSSVRSAPGTAPDHLNTTAPSAPATSMPTEPPSATSTPSASSPAPRINVQAHGSAPAYNNNDNADRFSLVAAQQQQQQQARLAPAAPPGSRLRVATDATAAAVAAAAIPTPLSSFPPIPSPAATAAAATATAAASLPTAIPGLPLETFKSLLEDSLSQFRQQIHRDVHNMHIDLIRQFEIQKNEVEVMLQHHSINDSLLQEIERLRQENRALQQKF